MLLEMAGARVPALNPKPSSTIMCKGPDWNLSEQNIGTNDNNTHNNVTNERYYKSYIQLIETVHKTWPKTQIIVHGLWGGFTTDGNSYRQTPAFVDEIQAVVKYFNTGKYAREREFVHYFNTTGILQHNDIAPQWHPTDVGQIKVAAQFIQFIKMKFGWMLSATGSVILEVWDA